MSKTPSGYLTLTLHAHLPYVVNHGTWPHGLEWLLEVAAETYLPLLRMFRSLERDGIGVRCNLNLTPILLEQLTHSVFQAEFPQYLERKIASAREDEAVFLTTGEPHYAEMSRFWQKFYTEAFEDFRDLDGNIVSGFRKFADKGMLDVITCAATHAYLPLLGTDESVRAQIHSAVTTHQRHFDRAPRGIWIPECGYRPAGLWSFPVETAGKAPAQTTFPRTGIEQALSAAGLDFFFVDTHLVEQSARIPSPYEKHRQPESTQGANPRSVYRPYLVQSNADTKQTIVFARDPHTGLQVWSGDAGYPGDNFYLDFHKKRWPGGHRYWRVTGNDAGQDAKEPYNRERAAERVQEHASHFVHTVWESLAPSFGQANPPLLCAPFDAELFGHWWFEGIHWLEAVIRVLHQHATDLGLISAAGYLDRYPAQQAITMPEGSWGAGGGNESWLNDETAWTYSELYAAELFTRDFCSSSQSSATDLGVRLTKQLCRELLLLQSSDWQFLITTGAARDYAEGRFSGHLDAFNQLRSFCQFVSEGQSLPPEAEARLAIIEATDNIFPDIDPGLWAVPQTKGPA